MNGMTHKKRIIFVQNSQPLAGVQVRHDSWDETLVTNDEGQIHCEVEEGFKEFEVFHQGRWNKVSLEVTEKQSLLIVDINTHATGSFTAQIPGGFKGQVFGERYVFEEVLGRGGMGIVVQANDKLLHRTVAIKMLNEEFLENVEAQQIFLEEARSIATLRHPNLVAIYDVTMIDGRAMIVFEHIDGQDLDTLFENEGCLSEASVVGIAVQLTRALKYLHDKGILHRDIKPANVLVQPDGVLKIIDFGLARSLEEIAIKGTKVRGTPAYMAPEQIDGSQLLAATDIYQLGVSLFELLAGQLPFSSGNMAYAHMHMDPPAVSEFVTLHEPEVGQLIHACLQKKPEDRPSAHDLFGAFQAIYARHAAFYEQHTSDCVKHNAAMLFSETMELAVPEGLKRPAITGATQPVGNGLSGVSVEQGLSEDGDSHQKMLIAVLGLVLLLIGLGSVIVMILSSPEENPSTPRANELSVSASQETPLVESASTKPAPPVSDVVEERPTDTVGSKNVVEEPVKPVDVVAPVVDTPEEVPSKPAVVNDEQKNSPKEPPVNVREEETRARVDEPVKSPDTEKTQQPDDAVDKMASDDEVSVNANEDVKSPQVVDVAAKEAEKEVSDKEESSGESTEGKTTRRVIRKKIIRKKVIRKKAPAASGSEDGEKSNQAPVSF